MPAMRPSLPAMHGSGGALGCCVHGCKGIALVAFVGTLGPWFAGWMLAAARRVGRVRWGSSLSSSSGRGLPPVRLDFKYTADHVDEVAENVRRRKCGGDPASVARLYKEHLQRNKALEDARRERKRAAKEGGQNVAAARERGRTLKAQVKAMEEETNRVHADLLAAAWKLPNQTHPESPVGPEENAVEVGRFGAPPSAFKRFPSSPRDHLDLCAMHDLIDTTAGATVAGSNFVFLKNEAALLELSLVLWAMKELNGGAHGFTPIAPPDVALDEIVARCGFQPRDSAEAGASQIYSLTDTAMSLVGTAEISLAGMKSGTVFEEATLPRKFAGFSHCFRREAGARGAHNRGLYRVHQFSKVEMFAFCTPEQSEAELHAMVERQTDLLSQLGLHGRVLDMPTEELGASAYRKFDVEVYMPGRGTWGEVCSASNCTDYQSRRLGIEYQPQGAKKTFVHTINATAIAVPRIILALLETHQLEDGRVRVPDVLQPYLGQAFIGGE